MCYNDFNGVRGISIDAPFPLVSESAKKLTSTSRSFQLVIDATADQICTIPRKLSMGLAQFCLIGGPKKSIG